MAQWDPMVQDYFDPSFNTYDKGPAKGLGPARQHVNGDACDTNELYIVGIPRTLTREGLVNIFSKCGKVKRADIKRPRDDTANSTFGFVSFENSADSLKAIENFNGYEISNGKYRLGVRIALTEEQKQQRQVEQMKAGIPSFGDNSDESDTGAPFVSNKNRADSLERSSPELIVPFGRGKPLQQASPPGSPGRQKNSQQEPIKQPSPQRTAEPTKSDPIKTKKMPEEVSIGKCTHCGKEAKHRCRKCQTFYCSGTCQKKDWEAGHKLQCKRIREQRETPKTPPQPPTNKISIQGLAESFDKQFEVTVEEGAAHEMLERSGLPKDVIKDAMKPPLPKQQAHQAKPTQMHTPPQLFGQAPTQPHSSNAPTHEITPPASDTRIVERRRPMKANFKHEVLDYGKEMEVTISNVLSPVDFSVQLVMNQAILTQFTVQIRQEFIKPCVTSYTPERGEVCAAQYAADQEWYRVLVKQINLDGTMEVLFVDYGNTEQVKVADVRKLPPYLCDMAIQAIQCVMPIKPVSGDVWTQESLQILVDHGFPDPSKKFQCVPILTQGDKPIVEIIDTQLGKNVCDAMVSAGVAVRVIPQVPSAVQSNAQKPLQSHAEAPVPSSPAVVVSPRPTEAHPQLTTMPRVEPPAAAPTVTAVLAPPPILAPHNPTAQKYLQPGNVIEIEVQELISPSQFYIHVKDPTQLSQLGPLKQEMTVHYSSKEPKKGFKPNANKLYACRFAEDNEWYRAMVYDFTAQCASVLYLDYGNHELVAFAQLQSLESTFCTLPFQAVCCRLSGLTGTGENGEWTQQALQTFAAAVGGKPLRARVDEVDDAQVSLQIKLPDGKKLSGMLLQANVAVSTTQSKSAPMTPKAQVSPQLAKPQQQRSPQLPTQSPQLAKPQQQQQRSPQLPTQSPQLAKPQQQQQQRSPQLPTQSPQLAKPQQQQQQRSPQLPTQSPQLAKPQQQRSPQLPRQSVQQPPKQSPQQSKPSPQVAPSHPVPTAAACSIASLPTLSLPDQKLHCVHVSDASDLNCITALLVTDEVNQQLAALRQSLQETYASYSGRYTPSAVGALVVARFSEDKEWYRGEVLNIRTTACLVRFIDYGNSEEVEFASLAEVQPALLTVPLLGIRCTLSGTNGLAAGKTWDPNIIANKQFAMKVNAVKDGILDIELIDENSKNINQILLENGVLAPQVLVANSEANVSGPPELQLSEAIQDVTLAHYEAPWELYMQLVSEEPMAALTQIMQEINTMCKGSKGEYRPRKQEVVAVYYQEDQCWYRGIALSVSGRRVKVDLCDFGNHAIVEVDCIRQLEPRFRDMPRYALRCCLGEITEGKCKWSGKAIEEVGKLLSEKVLRVYIEPEKRNDDGAHIITDVMVSINEEVVNLPDYLVASKILDKQYLCGLGAGKIPMDEFSLPRQHLPPAAIDVSIQYAKDPGQFYINIMEDWAFGSLQQMLLLLNKTVKDQPPYAPTNIGEMVAAMFQNVWYRATVTGLKASKFEVFFVDFGNTELVELADVRALPDTFLELPAQAIECYLRGIVPASGADDAWSAEAVQLINKLVMETVKLVPQDGAGDQDKHGVDLMIPSANDHLTQILIKEGLAKKAPQKQQKQPTPEATIAQLAKDAGIPVEVPPHLMTQLGVAELPPTSIVMVTEAPQLDRLYVQTAEGAAAVASQASQITLHCEASKQDPNFAPKTGELCCAKYSVDGEWYRAVVTEAGAGSWKVMMVDYGSIDTVDKNGIRRFSDQLMKPPAQAVACGLHDINSNSSDALAVFLECASSKALHCSIRGKHGDMPKVKLVNPQEDIDINEKVKKAIPAPAPKSLEEENRELKERLKKMEDMMMQMAAGKK